VSILIHVIEKGNAIKNSRSLCNSLFKSCQPIQYPTIRNDFFVLKVNLPLYNHGTAINDKVNTVIHDVELHERFSLDPSFAPLAPVTPLMPVAPLVPDSLIS
jgi:hypothetical protein